MSAYLNLSVDTGKNNAQPYKLHQFEQWRVFGLFFINLKGIPIV